MKERIVRKNNTTRINLFDATFKCIQEQGISELSLRSIARAAGVNQATIYYYFENKEELLTEFIRYLFDKMIISVQKNILTEIATPEKKVDDLLVAAKEFIKEKKELFVVFIDCWSLSMRNKTMQEIFSNLFNENRRILTSLMEQMKSQGFFKNVSSDFFGTSVISYMSGLALVKHILKTPIQYEDHLNEWGKIFRYALRVKKINLK